MLAITNSFGTQVNPALQLAFAATIATGPLFHIAILRGPTPERPNTLENVKHVETIQKTCRLATALLINITSKNKSVKRLCQLLTIVSALQNRVQKHITSPTDKKILICAALHICGTSTEKMLIEEMGSPFLTDMLNAREFVYTLCKHAIVARSILNFIRPQSNREPAIDWQKIHENESKDTEKACEMSLEHVKEPSKEDISAAKKYLDELASEKRASLKEKAKKSDFLAHDIPAELEDDALFSKYQCIISQNPIRFIVRDPKTPKAANFYEFKVLKRWLETNLTSPMNRQKITKEQLEELKLEPEEQKLIERRVAAYKKLLK